MAATRVISRSPELKRDVHPFFGGKPSKSTPKPKATKKRAFRAWTPKKADAKPIVAADMEKKDVEANDEKRPTTPRKSPKPAAKPAKPHPFFLGKAAVKAAFEPKEDAPAPSAPAVSRLSPSRESEPLPKRQSTPPKASLFRYAPHGTSATATNGSFAPIMSAAKMQKTTGALEPTWPAKDMAHVRGSLELLPSSQLTDSKQPVVSERSRKAKHALPMPSADEDILNSVISKLNLDAIKADLAAVDENHHLPADKTLRIPRRHFESGIKLQRHIQPQIKASVSARRDYESEDELAAQNPGLFPHIAISRLYQRIPDSLSAYDKGECSTQSWVQKYAPQSAAEVLQSGREATILKEWLQTLTVDAVDNKVNKKPSAKSKRESSPPKKKRKSTKLDGFVVSDGEEDNEMEEVDDFESPDGQGGLRTVVRRGDAAAKGSKDGGKLQNAVLISGPNGCGKTAAIYAVAQELDFEIFEINSGSRRSGKDVLEKVGDMTRNHLVQHKRQSSNEPDGDMKRASDALDADLKSGKQGTMMSFFQKPAPIAKYEGYQLTKIAGPKKEPKPETPKSKVQQKQSLILLEEVDVLFAQDTEFWKTVLDLIKASKRPFIITCNDESFVPHNTLPLHAIIRFQPPPIDLAVDYMLLTAANQGHVIERKAVKQLYQSHKYDLRASMTELEFWCQIGVGDRKGGFDWFVPRWPKGKDLDAHGRTLRVVSEGTYRSGMGMLGHDYLHSTNSITSAEEEILKETWQGWQLDAGDWHNSLHPSLTYDERSPLDTSSPKEKFAALSAYQDFTEALSMADLSSHGYYATSTVVPLDPTTPELPQKRLDDNILGIKHIQADLLTDSVKLDQDIALAIKTLSRSVLHNSAIPATTATSRSSTLSFPPPTEKQTTRFIISSLNAPRCGITRPDFACFDPIASPTPSTTSFSTLDPSVLDRTLAILSLDVAPYIRSIISYDAQLAEDRIRLSGLLSQGGKPGKRMRTTRAAISALEGGERKRTRRERWFGDAVNSSLVRRTGCPDWEIAQKAEVAKQTKKALKELEAKQTQEKRSDVRHDEEEDEDMDLAPKTLKKMRRPSV